MSIDPATASGWGVAVACFLAALFERLQSHKKEKKTEGEKAVLSEAMAYKAKAELMEKMMKDYEELAKKEHDSHEATREYWHKKATEFQVELSKSNDKCAELQSKTDITKLETILIAQGQTLTIVGEGIRQLLAYQHVHSPRSEHL